MTIPTPLPGYLTTTTQAPSDARPSWLVLCRAISPDNRCPVCKTPSTQGRGRYRRDITDTPLFGTPVTLAVSFGRYACRACHRDFNETLPGVQAHLRLTDRCVQTMRAARAKGVLRVALSEATGLSPSTVDKIVRLTR